MNKKMNNPKISYDKQAGVLSIEMKRVKSVDSDVQGNMVIDYDKKGEVVRVNLYNFSFAQFRQNLKAIENFSRHLKLPFLAR